MKAAKIYRLGDLIELCDERNTEGKYNSFYGINIEKEFMPTAADTNGLDESKYKIIRKNRFVFSGMQTGRDGCIRISMYEKEDPVLVSPAYTTFEISKKEIVLPEYFFMIFQSKEMDRYGAFCSDGSIRSNLDLERFCDFQLVLPPLAVQQKAVAVYNALKANLAAYEQGLDDLKLVCDGFIDTVKNKVTPMSGVAYYRLGDLIEICDERNTNGKYTLDDVRGVSIQKELIQTKADMNGVPLTNYKIIRNNTFVFNVNTARMGDKFAIALCKGKDYLVSSIYEVFKSKDESILLSDYLMLFMTRAEFDRYIRFNSWGSAREVFTYEDMCDVQIPLPSLEVQQSIVNMYKCYTERRRIATELKTKIKTICPILIKGSLKNM